MDPGSGFQGTLEHGNCKAELALRVIQGRWKLLILRELLEGVRRFSDLQRALATVQQGVSQKVLTAQCGNWKPTAWWSAPSTRRCPPGWNTGSRNWAGSCCRCWTGCMPGGRRRHRDPPGGLSQDITEERLGWGEGNPG